MYSIDSVDIPLMIRVSSKRGAVCKKFKKLGKETEMQKEVIVDILAMGLFLFSN